MKLYKVFFWVILMVFILSACTQKKNSVGFDPGIEPKIIELDFNYFGNYLSFEDSISNYYNNSKLVIGNYFSSNFQNRAYTLLKNITLPDSIISLESPVIIQLEKVESHNFTDISSQTLKFGTLYNSFKENEATWYNATDTLNWSNADGFSANDYEPREFENVEVVNDSILLELPADLLLNWVENDSTNNGIVIYTEQEDAFLELLSAESESVYLRFSYVSPEVDTLVDFSSKFTSDTFIYETDQQFQRFNNELKVSNIQPIKIFLEFDISDSVFINYPNSGIDNADDYRRMSINKAELILSAAEFSDYPLSGSMNLTPYLVLADTLELEDNSSPPLLEDQYESLYDGTSSDSLTSENFTIDMKYIVQFITSGERENKGIMIESIYENRDFRNITFADICYQDIEKRPKLRIIYTPPYLDE